MWVEITHWVIQSVHSSEKAYLTSCDWCDETQSYLSERFMNISNLRKIYHGDFYIFVFLVSTNQRHKKVDIDYSREQGIHDYGWNHSDNGKA